MAQFNDPVPPYADEVFCDGHGGEDGDHCCYNGQWGECPHLVTRPDAVLPERKYSCGLYEELGSWNQVYQDPRYQADVQPFYDDMANRFTDWNRNVHGCGDWPSRAMVNKAYDQYQQGDQQVATMFCCYSRKCKEVFNP